MSILRITKEETISSSSLPLSSNANEDENNLERLDYGNIDDEEDAVSPLLESGTAVVSSSTTFSSTSSSRMNRRKKIALGLVASIAAAAGAAKMGVLGGGYSNEMIARDAIVTGLTSVLAVVMNRGITWGYEAGKYDSKTGRKLAHILSAPLFIVTWPFFSNASGARVFAGLVTLTNMYRLYLAGTGDAAESSLATILM